MNNVLLNLQKMFRYSSVKKLKNWKDWHLSKFLNLQEHNGFHRELQHKELSGGLVPDWCSRDNTLWKARCIHERCTRFAFETKRYSFYIIVGQSFCVCQQVFTLSSNLVPVHSEMSGKLAQRINNLEKLQNKEGFYFKQHGRKFFENVKEMSELSRQTHRHDNIADFSINWIIEAFKEKEMHPFLTAFFSEDYSAINLDDPEIKAFDVFNNHIDLTEFESTEKTIALFEFYGRC